MAHLSKLPVCLQPGTAADGSPLAFEQTEMLLPTSMAHSTAVPNTRAETLQQRCEIP